MPASTPRFPGRHDHAACASRAIRQAELACRERNERLTENRRAVLELLLAEHRPFGAYEIVERFDWRERRPAPAQIYRALAFLESLGLAHRIVSRNAYVACSRPGERHDAVFLVCDRCAQVAECDGSGPRSEVGSLAERSGFRLGGQVLEATGLCPECAENAADAVAVR